MATNDLKSTLLKGGFPSNTIFANIIFDKATLIFSLSNKVTLSPVEPSMMLILSGPQTAFFSHTTPKSDAYPRRSNSFPIYNLRFTFESPVSISVLITSSEYKCSMQISGVAALNSGIGSIKEYTLLPHFLNSFPSFPPSFLLVSL